MKLMSPHRRLAVVSCALVFLGTAPAGPLKAAEILGRGTIALARDDGVFVGWRLLPWDDPDAGFHVYRGAAAEGLFTRLSSTPVTASTNYLDDSALAGETYWYLVRTVDDAGVEGPDSNASVVTAGSWKNYVEMEVQPYEGELVVMRSIGAGDLNGDGVLDFVLAAHNSDAGIPVRYEAFLSGGGTWQSSWRVESGLPLVRNPFLIIWDMDGDALAEVMVRMGDAGAVTVLDGLDGTVRASADWPSPGQPNYSNAVAALLEDEDGDTVVDPFLVTHSGGYGAGAPPVFTAFRLSGGTLTQVRQLVIGEVWDDDHPDLWGIGGHGLPAADLTGDGRDMIMPCGTILYDDWSGYWRVNAGHCDACFPADIDPTRPGAELFMACEHPAYAHVVKVPPSGDPERLWDFLSEATAEHHNGFHKGWCSDLLEAHEGMECFGLELDDTSPTGLTDRLFTFDGTDVTSELPAPITVRRYPLDWHRGDQLKALFYGECLGAARPGTHECAAMLSRLADLVGDAREDIVTYDEEARKLILYSNTELLEARYVTPLADRGYRAVVSRMAVGYPTNWIPAKTNQPRQDIVPEEEPGPLCGDLACDDGETCIDCPMDCGPCADALEPVPDDPPDTVPDASADMILDTLDPGADDEHDAGMPTDVAGGCGCSMITAKGY